ncbi:MAG: CPBP family intramembrane glutamic endopeptidase [Actinomycetota bacterium]
MHRALRPPADAALNLASAMSLTAFALRTGCTAAELGLDRTDLRRGLKTGSIAGACCSVGIGLAAALPSTRRFFLDARLRGMSRRKTLYHASLRIPVATALAEEIMFRSALHALFAREHSLRTTLSWTSFLFGLWHILPTLDTFEGNPASSIVQNPGRARLMAAVGVTGTTAGAGLFFSFLRLRSRSVAAAVITHAAINIVALVLGKALVAWQPDQPTHGSENHPP